MRSAPLQKHFAATSKWSTQTSAEAYQSVCVRVCVGVSVCVRVGMCVYVGEKECSSEWEKCVRVCL